MTDGEVDWILSFILGDPQGAEIAERIDSTIAKLPGLEWFDRLGKSRDEALRALGVEAVRESGERNAFPMPA